MNAHSMVLLLSVAACATAPGTRPEDMSREGHAAAARAEEKEGKEHAKEFDPTAKKASIRCPAGGVRGTDSGRICWTSVRNATQEHLAQAEEHRRLAEAHRRASAALQEAEDRACVGVADGDRDASPFDHVEDLASVEPIAGGALVRMKPVEGLTREDLQRVLDCHLARNAALGHVVPEMPSCPLVPRGVVAGIREDAGSFSIAVTSSDPATASEILARATKLAPAR